MKKPSALVSPTAEGIEEAMEAVRENCREQGCLCGDRLEIVLLENPTGEGLVMSCGHHPLCPLGQALFG